MPKVCTKSKLGLTFTFVFAVTSAAAVPLDERQRIQEQPTLNARPLWDAINYFFVQPTSGLNVFLRQSIDDTLELSVKCAVFYLMYFRTPLATASRRYRVAAFPIIYLSANEIGDKVGDWAEILQPGSYRKTGLVISRGVGPILNDVTEDIYSIGCYISKFARGFSLPLFWAQLVTQIGGPSWMVPLLKGYAYFSAATKVILDTHQCAIGGDVYGDWAEEQWNALIKKTFPVRV